MKKVRYGIVGVGSMGISHTRDCAKKGGRDFCLSAVCDHLGKKAKKIGEEFDVPYFENAQDMYDSGLCDAVIIATPHYWHAPLTIRAARAGLHVLCEKPLSSTVGDAHLMVRECKKRKVALGAMLQQRLRNIMIKAKKIVDSGRLGELFRIQVVASNWFRTQKYYDSGAWRGTWDGEGGGILINQAPHTLDLFQWFGGMPKRVHAVLSTRAHNIEVEDTANIFFEYDNGKIGYFYATTAEQPGYEQIMLCGDKGTLIIENEKIKFGKLKVPVRKFIMKCKNAWSKPGEQKTTWQDIKYPVGEGAHVGVIRAFARHLLRGTVMVATGLESINELELSNAAYISGFKNKTVTFPVNAVEIDRLISKLERERSTGKGGQMRKIANRDLKRLMKNSSR